MEHLQVVCLHPPFCPPGGSWPVTLFIYEGRILQQQIWNNSYIQEMLICLVHIGLGNTWLLRWQIGHLWSNKCKQVFSRDLSLEVVATRCRTPCHDLVQWIEQPFKSWIAISCPMAWPSPLILASDQPTTTPWVSSLAQTWVIGFTFLKCFAEC